MGHEVKALEPEQTNDPVPTGKAEKWMYLQAPPPPSSTRLEEEKAGRHQKTSGDIRRTGTEGNKGQMCSEAGETKRKRYFRTEMRNSPIQKLLSFNSFR